MTNKTKSAGENSKIVERLEYYSELSIDDFRKIFGIHKPPLNGLSVRQWELNDDQIITVKKILTRIGEA